MCTVCKKTRRINHRYIHVKGKCKEQCEVCGAIGKTQHTWDGFKCTICGETRPNPETLEQLEQKRLAEIAKNDDAGINRIAAVEKLTDKTVLADIAQNDSYHAVRKKAVEKLTDQTVLAEIAQNASYSDVRMEAINLITDKTLKEELLTNEFDIERICTDIMKYDLYSSVNATRDIFSLLYFGLLTPENKSRILVVLLNGMKRPVPNAYDYSLESVPMLDSMNHGRFWHTSFNGNYHIGHLLSELYKDFITTLEEKAQIKALDDILMAYTDCEGRRSPVFFDCENHIRLHGVL